MTAAPNIGDVEPPPRVPTQKLKGIETATPEQADLIQRHIFYSRFTGCAWRRAGIERDLLRLSTAREVHTPTHKARWMPAGVSSVVPVDDLDRMLNDKYPKLRAEPVVTRSMDSVRLMVVPR